MRRCDGRVLLQQRQRQRLSSSSSSCTWVVLSLSKCVVFINNSTATAAQGSSECREGEAEWVGQGRGVRSVANTKRMCAANSSSNSRGSDRGTQCNCSCNLLSLSSCCASNMLQLRKFDSDQRKLKLLEAAHRLRLLLLLLLLLLLVAVVVLGLLRHLRL